MIKLLLNKFTLIVLVVIASFLFILNKVNPGILSRFGSVRGASTLSYAELKTAGLYDVTAPEFGADPTGARDSTAAIQKAMDVAYEAGRKRDSSSGVVFFPSGTYTISNTLVALHDRHGGATSHVLMGSTKGPLPKIVLKENTFNDNKASNTSL